MSLISPWYKPTPALIDLLNQAVREDVLKLPSSLARGQRKRLSEQIAIDATMAMLATVCPDSIVIDANTSHRNVPGYDLLVDGRIRLQVKGGTYVESVGWTHSIRPNAADLDYDVMVFVDAGVMLDARVGRLERFEIPQKSHVEFYVVPNAVVRGWVQGGRHINGKGAHIYAYKRPLTPGTREHDGQTRELFDWRNRFDVITSLLR